MNEQIVFEIIHYIHFYTFTSTMYFFGLESSSTLHFYTFGIKSHDYMILDVPQILSIAISLNWVELSSLIIIILNFFYSTFC